MITKVIVLLCLLVAANAVELPLLPGLRRNRKEKRYLQSAVDCTGTYKDNQDAINTAFKYDGDNTGPQLIDDFLFVLTDDAKKDEQKSTCRITECKQYVQGDGNAVPANVAQFSTNAYSRTSFQHWGTINMPYGVYYWRQENLFQGYKELGVIACITNGMTSQLMAQAFEPNQKQYCDGALEGTAAATIETLDFIDGGKQPLVSVDVSTTACGNPADWECTVQDGMGNVNSDSLVVFAASGKTAGIIIDSSDEKGVPNGHAQIKCVFTYSSEVKMDSNVFAYSINTKCGSSDAIEARTDSEPESTYTTSWFQEPAISFSPLDFFDYYTGCDIKCIWDGVSADNSKSFEVSADGYSTFSVATMGVSTEGFEETAAKIKCTNVAGINDYTGDFEVVVSGKCKDNLSWDSAIDLGEVDYSDSKELDIGSDVAYDKTDSKLAGFTVADTTNCWPPAIVGADHSCIVMGSDNQAIQSGQKGLVFTLSQGEFKIKQDSVAEVKHEFYIKCQDGYIGTDGNPQFTKGKTFTLTQLGMCAGGKSYFPNPNVPESAERAFSMTYGPMAGLGERTDTNSVDASQWQLPNADCGIDLYEIVSDFMGTPVSENFPVTIDGRGQLKFENQNKDGQTARFQIMYSYGSGAGKRKRALPGPTGDFQYTQTSECSTALSKQSDPTLIYGDQTFDYDDGKKEFDYSDKSPKTWDMLSANPTDCPLQCVFKQVDIPFGDLDPQMPQQTPVLDFTDNKLTIDTAGLYNGKDPKDGLELKFRYACKTDKANDYTMGDRVYTVKINSYCSMAKSISKTTFTAPKLAYMEAGKDNYMVDHKIVSTGSYCSMTCTATDMSGVTIFDTDVDQKAPLLYISTDNAGYDGKDYQFDFTCTNSGGQKLTQIISATQSSKCLTTLEADNSAWASEIAYDYKSTQTPRETGITSTDTTNCPLTECKLMYEDGDGRYQDYTGDKFSITNELKVLFNSDITTSKGFSDTAIVNCKNGKKSKLTSKIKIKQASPCKGSLVPKVFTVPTLEYNRNTMWHTIASEDLFSVAEPVVCPILTCKVMINGKDAPNENNFKMVKRILTTDKFDLLILQGEGKQGGYTINKVQIRCQDMDWYHTTAEFVGKQNEDPCWTAMEPQTIGDQNTIDFARNTPWLTVNNVMRTKDAVNCPITSCKLIQWKTIGGLFARDVAKDYTDETFVKVNSKRVRHTYDLYFKSDYNEVGGKEVTRLQLSCGNGKQTAKSVDVFNYKQFVNPCLNSVSKNNNLSTKVTIPANKGAVPYTTDTDKLAIFNFETMYNVANVDKCALTCGVYDTDCESSVSTRITLKDNWNLQAVQNYAEGYGPDSVCVKCANLDAGFQFPYMVKQIFRCDGRMTSLGNTQQDDEGVLKYMQDNKCIGFLASGLCKTYRTFQDDVFGSYFANSNDDAKCAVTGCSLMKPGCSEAHDSNNVRMKKIGSKWTLQAWNKPQYGYIEDFCLSCTNGGKNVALSGNKVWPRQTITYDNYKVQLPSKCTYSMTKRLDFNEDINFDFDVSALGLNRDMSVWTKIFNQGDSTYCPILDCKLYQAGNCEVNKTPFTDSVLSLAKTSSQDWTISVNDQKFNGFTANYCVYCNNEYQRIWWDNLKITQTERCSESGKLVKKDFRAINEPSYRYSDAAVSTKIADVTDLFTNTDPDPQNVKQCLIHTCKVYESNCETLWNFLDPKKKGFSMTSASPFTLSYDSTMIHGFKYDICIKCLNPQMSATNTFSIQQESKCLPYYNELTKRPFILSPEEIKKYDEATTNEDQETLDMKPTKYKYHYEHDFSSSEKPVQGNDTTDEDFKVTIDAYIDMNYVDVGFNPNMHTALYSGLDPEEEPSTSHAVSDTYNYNETASLFFLNGDKTNCNYDKCELKAKGCIWPYTQTEHLKINEKFPWNIVAAANITDGYNTTFCVKCSNAWDSIQQDDVVFTQHQKTNWMMIVIIIAAVAVVLVGLLSSVCSFKKGKVAGAMGSAEATEMQSGPKIANKHADQDEGATAQAEIEDFHQNEMEVSKKPNDADNGSDDAPASVASASFYQASANTGRPLQAEVTDQ